MQAFERKTHVGVIGAGIVGINCALELQSLGFQVSLLDKQDIAQGCSKGNAGHFATEQVFPLAEPQLLLQLPKLLLDPLGPMALSPRYVPKALPWFLRFIFNMRHKARQKNKQALQALNEHAIDYYKPLLRAANAEHLLVTKGSLLVFESADINTAQTCYQHYKNAGIPVELLDQSQLQKLEPNLNSSVRHALFFTDVAHTINPYQICQVLAKQALALGATFQQVNITQVLSDEHGITIKGQQVQHTFEEHYDHIVIATGAWSKPLLRSLGYKLPLEAERGYSVDLADETKLLTRPVASAERKFIITPMSHGLRLSGTVEFAGLEQAPNIQRAKVLFEHTKQLINHPHKTPDFNQSWLGCRPSLPDSLPVIGEAPKHKGIYFALGHQHLGLTQGAITGKLIGQLISGKKTDIDTSPYCISRFN